MQANLPRAAAFAALIAVQAVAYSLAGASERAERPIDELKQLFLECDDASMRGLLDSATAATCSLHYEALKQRAFGGDFQRLLAWWQARALARGAPAARRFGAE